MVSSARVYVTRHGQSLTNESRTLVLDHGDNPLTTLGRQQAMEYGAVLRQRGVHLARVVTSPLLRAQQTTALILDVMDQLDLRPILDPAFRELDWENVPGDEPLESTRYADVAVVPLVMPAKRLRSTESQVNVYERVVGRLKELVLEQPAGQDLLIVSHHFPLKAVQAWVSHQSPNAMPDYDPRNLCDVSLQLDLLRELARS